MKQNGKHFLACILDSEAEEYNIRVVLNYLEFVNNIFNLQKFDYMFSRLYRSKNSLVV